MPSLISLLTAHPLARKVLKIAGLGLGSALIVSAAVWGFNSWRDSVHAAGEKVGFSKAEAAYATAVEAANQVIKYDQAVIQRMSELFDELGAARETAVQTEMKTKIERVIHEVQADPSYSDCRVSDGMLANIQTARAAGDSAVAATSPTVDQ